MNPDDEPLTVDVTLTREQWRWLRGGLQALAIVTITGPYAHTTTSRDLLDAQGALQRQMPADLDERNHP